jgi:hypothetical protein
MSYPLLVVHDGGDYLDYASMKVVLDNLIHERSWPVRFVDGYRAAPVRAAERAFISCGWVRGPGRGEPRNVADLPQHRDEDQLCRVT